MFGTERSKDAAKDIIGALLRKERRHAYASRCHRPNGRNSLQYDLRTCYQNIPPAATTEGGREEICCMLTRIVNHFDKDDEVVEVALDFLDRFLLEKLRERREQEKLNGHEQQKLNQGSREEFFSTRSVLLYCFSSLGLAIKLYCCTSGCPFRDKHMEKGTYRHFSDIMEKPSRSTSKKATYDEYEFISLIDVSRGIYEMNDFVDAEVKLLSTLNFLVHPPTSFAYLRHFFDLCPKDRHSIFLSDSYYEGDCSQQETILWKEVALSEQQLTLISDVSEYLIKKVICDSQLSTFKPSVIAVAVFTSAIKFFLAIEQHARPNSKEIDKLNDDMAIFLNAVECATGHSRHSPGVWDIRYKLAGLLKSMYYRYRTKILATQPGDQYRLLPKNEAEKYPSSRPFFQRMSPRAVQDAGAEYESRDDNNECKGEMSYNLFAESREFADDSGEI